MQILGIKKAFVPAEADFTNITAAEPLYVSKVQQNICISIDEKGCEAAAYSKIDFPRSGPRCDTIKIKLDRPFIFAISGGAGDAPLFIGVVNNPAAH